MKPHDLLHKEKVVVKIYVTTKHHMDMYGNMRRCSMSKNMMRIWCRLIHKGEKTILDVPEEYRDLVAEVYEELYGEPIPDTGDE